MKNIKNIKYFICIYLKKRLFYFGNNKNITNILIINY